MPGLVIRLGGARALASLSAKIAVILVLLVGLPLWALWPFGRTHAPRVEVHDEAQILQEESTQSALGTIRFRQDVRLAVVTLDTDLNTNLNAAVLEYARTHEPSWIDAQDPNYWADGLIILAVSPSGRWVGTYFGEDVKVDLTTQERIQNAAKDQFRSSDWAGGIGTMAQTTASIIGRPVASEVTVILLCTMGIGGGLIIACWMLWARAEARRYFKRTQQHYTQVITDYEATQIRAGLIPTDDAHGAQVLARFGWFEDHYAELTRALRDFEEPRGAAWFETGRRAKARDMADRAQRLDSLDDAIANTAALLTLSEGWQKAWDNELGPVYEDLASLRNLCGSVQAESGLDVEPDRAWVRQRSNRLAAMTNEMAAGRLSPADALDELDETSQELRARADSLARRALEADTSSLGRTRLERYEQSQSRRRFGDSGYAGWWVIDGHRSSYNPAATIRINPGSPGAEASGVRWTGAGSASHFSSPVSGLVTGYSSAATYSPPSSSGGSSFSGGGYSGGGFSGGSFSGAGSSSRF